MESSLKFKEKRTIFVQIASYRDPELIPTIRDMLKKARYPERLRIGICHQYNSQDKFNNLDKYKKDKRFRIIDIHFLKSKGVCWARNLIQGEYRDETYTLQIDSHTRFIKHWDAKLIRIYRLLLSQGFPKPILSSYPLGYIPGKNKIIKKHGPPFQIIFEKFTKGFPELQSFPIIHWKELAGPMPAKFLAGGFYFTNGKFCREVPYDPEIYFFGEEISVSLRAFTHGYDIFHPHKNLLWHYWDRINDSKHWDDNKTWESKNAKSYAKLRRLFDVRNSNRNYDFGQYGLGKERTLSDYKEYAQIHFPNK